MGELVYWICSKCVLVNLTAKDTFLSFPSLPWFQEIKSIDWVRSKLIPTSLFGNVTMLHSPHNGNWDDGASRWINKLVSSANVRHLDMAKNVLQNSNSNNSGNNRGNHHYHNKWCTNYTSIFKTLLTLYFDNYIHVNSEFWLLSPCALSSLYNSGSSPFSLQVPFSHSWLWFCFVLWPSELIQGCLCEHGFGITHCRQLNSSGAT